MMDVQHLIERASASLDGLDNMTVEERETAVNTAYDELSAAVAEYAAVRVARVKDRNAKTRLRLKAQTTQRKIATKRAAALASVRAGDAALSDLQDELLAAL
jgi:hypothetical protein